MKKIFALLLVLCSPALAQTGNAPANTYWGNNTGSQAPAKFVMLPGSFSGFANPSASLGLSAINGSATTAMRSDAAPALSQAITPTWTGAHIFDAASGVPITADAASGQNIALFNYGAISALPVTSTGGYTGIQSLVNSNGTMTNAANVAAIVGNSTRNAGQFGIATGGLFKASVGGTWMVGGTDGGAIAEQAVVTTSVSGTIFSGSDNASCTVTVGCIVRGREIDLGNSAAPVDKVGLIIVSNSGDTAQATSTATIAGGAGVTFTNSVGLQIVATGGGVGFNNGINTTKIVGASGQAVTTGGNLWIHGGYTANKGLAWETGVFTTCVLCLPNSTYVYQDGSIVSGSNTGALGSGVILATTVLQAGTVGNNTGQIQFGTSGGTQVLKPVAGATGTTTIPSGTNTLAASASSPIVLNAATGNLTCSTCVTTAGGQSIAGLTVTSSFTATGLVTNADLANSSLTVNGTAIALGASGTVTAAAGTLTGTTLASGVTTASLTTLGATVTAGSGSFGSWPFSTAVAFFGNSALNQGLVGNYALGQDASGNTFMNAASGATPSIRVANTTIAAFAAGVVIGAPTGGDKGSGTISVASGIYANGAAGVSTTCTETVGNTLVFTFGILTTKGANCT